MQDRILDTKHNYAHKLIPLFLLSKVILYLLSDGAETNCGIAHILGTVEPRYNEPLYNEVLGVTNVSLYPSNSKIYEKEPRYYETSS